jgi:glyoxylase-like metal-dependent hydrolase (beta-lactamase superfamily II)
MSIYFKYSKFYFFLILILCFSTRVHAQSFQNKVIILSDGYVKPIAGKEFLPGVKTDGARKVASTVALVQGKDTTLIVDPGMVANKSLIKNSLKKHNVTIDAVTHIFISHHHPDHTVNIGLFPNAEVIDFWARYKNDVWEDHPDNYEISPGITVIKTPGHTKEDASLIVKTAKGVYAFTHLWWFQDMSPKVDPLAWDQSEIEKHREKILEIADWIVPGHGEMFKNPKK